MKLVISNGDTKRELVGAFKICASTRDLKRLRDAIDHGLQRADRDGAAYGWIVEVFPEVSMKGDTPPKGWDE